MLKISKTALKPLKRRAGAQNVYDGSRSDQILNWVGNSSQLVKSQIGSSNRNYQSNAFYFHIVYFFRFRQGGGGGAKKNMFSETDLKIVNF